MTQISQMVGSEERPRIRNGGACPACGATVRAPLWRVATARVTLLMLAIVVSAASIFGMMRSAAGESTRGQHPRTTYSTACKACGASLTLRLA
jgi:hypothetical protein